MHKTSIFRWDSKRLLGIDGLLLFYYLIYLRLKNKEMEFG
jgi:hypothetical protein